MKHKTDSGFWKYFDKLPADIQKLANKQFGLLKKNIHHPSLYTKKIGQDLWSVRIGNHYRALAFEIDDILVWFWIGTHEDYNKLKKTKKG